jgi:hypothetical protein
MNEWTGSELSLELAKFIAEQRNEGKEEEKEHESISRDDPCYFGRMFVVVFRMPEGQERDAKLVKLHKEFRAVANEMVKVIQQELHLPDEQKTLKPATLGGIAGGYFSCLVVTCFSSVVLLWNGHSEQFIPLAGSSQSAIQ